MDINTFNAVKTYNSALKTLNNGAATSEKTENNGESFAAAKAAKEMVSTIAKSESTAAAFMTGNADPHSVVEAMASAELAVETAVTIRNRVVEAYQELLRMPI